MKSLATAMLTVCVSFSCFAQESSGFFSSFKPQAAYATFGAGYKRGPAGGAGLNLLLENNFGININNTFSSFDVEDIPDDFNNFFGSTPQNRLHSVNFLLVKEFAFGREKKYKWSIEAGPTLFQYWDKEIVEVDDSDFWFLDPYETETNNGSGSGIMVQARLRAPFRKVIGLETALYYDYNSHRSSVGFQINVMVGWLR